MRAAGRPGRGERARVAARVRELLASQPGDDPPAARADEPVPGPGSWLPDTDFERHVPRHGAAPRPPRWRWDPGRRGVLALGCAVLVVLAATGWWLLSSRPRELPVDSAVPTPAPVSAASVDASSVAASAASESPVSSGGASLVVDVAGKVMRPGIYELPAGSRVYDAVRAAGGARAGVSTLSLNLAEPVHDGEQIVVGQPGGAAAPPAAEAATSAGATAAVDLNTATLEQLEALPGVGPVLAQNILDWRSGHGGFSSIDQLQDVSGIGPAKFAEIKALVSL